jgi:uncharacterized cupin superfamily protein
MKKIALAAVSELRGSGYPEPFDQPCQTRTRRRLGDAAGLTQFGVNLLTLPPGAWSSQRHSHSLEDEFVYVLEGEVVLVTNEGEQTLRAGMCAGYPAGSKNGHHFVNRSAKPAKYLEMGTNVAGDTAFYPDDDLRLIETEHEGMVYAHKDGRRY